MHIEVVLSLIAIAGAAAVALACDFLRARNAQLHQAVVQMKAQKSGTGRGPKPTGPRRVEVKPLAAAVQEQPRPSVAAQAPTPMTPPEFTTRRGRRRPGPELAPNETLSSKPLPTPVAPVQMAAGQTTPAQIDTVKSNAALSAWLIERATARAAGKTAAELMPENPAGASTLALVPMPEPKESIVIDGHLWAALCEDVPATPRQGLELIRSTGATHLDVRVPAGIHSSAGLSLLLESGQLFTGLVISIGADARETGHAVEGFIAGLLRSHDFGCRSGEDEFLLICPGLHGADAQRHVSHVSERLWDYQLRTLGQFAIVFSLGGIDVQRESLPEAVASAKERMSQTRRRAEPVAQKRKAG